MSDGTPRRVWLKVIIPPRVIANALAWTFRNELLKAYALTNEGRVLLVRQEDVRQ